MKKKQLTKSFFLSILIFIIMCSIFTTQAFADGGTLRKTTSEEKKFLEELHLQLRSTLPKAPDNWQGTTEEEHKFDEVAEGFEKRPITMGVIASYTKNETQAEIEAKEKAMEKIGAKNKGSMDEMAKKQEELASKISKAAEKMDMKEIEKLQKEADILAKEAEKLGKNTETDLRSSDAGNLLKSTSANIRIGINQSEIYMSNPMELPKIDGNFVLREKIDGPQSDDNSKTVILIGPWKIEKNPEGALEIKSPYDEKAAYNKIMCAAVHIEAPAEVAEKIMKTIDLKKLNSLLSK